MDTLNEYLLIPVKCLRCGKVGEGRVSISGPHFKLSCRFCGFYSKFISKTTLPQEKQVKEMIWKLARQNLDMINEAKGSIYFYDKATGYYRRFEYWKLYIHLLKQTDATS